MVVAQVLSLQELVQVCLHEILHNISAQCHVKETSTAISLCFNAHTTSTILNLHIFVQSSPQNQERPQQQVYYMLSDVNLAHFIASNVRPLLSHQIFSADVCEHHSPF